MHHDRLWLPGHIALDLQYDLPRASGITFILSSGYGNDQFHEAAQLVLIDVLKQHDIGWVQYVYPERCPANAFTDLYISTGVSTLMWMYDWLRRRESGKICLFGYSFGGNISIEIALVRQLHALILLNPVFEYGEYRRQQLGMAAIKEWRRTKVIDLFYDGQPYPLGYRFLQEAERQDLEKRAASVNCEVHAFQAENDAILTPRAISGLAQASTLWEAHVVPGENADHNFEHTEALDRLRASLGPIVSSIAEG